MDISLSFLQLITMIQSAKLGKQARTHVKVHQLLIKRGDESEKLPKLNKYLINGATQNK